MRRTKLKGIITSFMVISMLIGGQSVDLFNKLTDTPSIAYAETNTGLQTSTGVVSKYIKYEDNLLENIPMEQMISMSETVTNESNPDMFTYASVNSYWGLDISKMNLTGKIYHAKYVVKYDGGQTNQDTFIKILDMKPNSVEGGVLITYTQVVYIEGKFSYILRKAVRGRLNFDHYNYMINEIEPSELSTPSTPSIPSTPTPVPTPTPELTPKSYSDSRLWGNNRYETSISIAKEFSNQPLDNVILATGVDFPDSLSASALAKKYNAPILLVNKSVEGSQKTLDYVKNNLKKDGKVYILGGTGVVSDDIINNLRGSGYINFERLGGKTRYETNRIINSELSVPQGTPVVIATGNDFADALSISSVSGINGMPIYLVNNGVIDSETQNAIKSISPSKIYIVGGTGVVSTGVESMLKGISSDIVRIGGSNRYETSINIAKHFNLDTTVACVGTGVDFPDALSGSVLATKNNAPIILVSKDVALQKSYLDSSKINKIYVLGGTGVVSDNIVTSLKK